MKQFMINIPVQVYCPHSFNIKEMKKFIVLWLLGKITKGDLPAKQEHISALTCMDPPISAEGEKINTS